MCIALIARNSSKEYPLIILHNRDEVRARPFTTMQWREKGTLLYGEDLKAGGTWLAVNRNGYFAFVTNIRSKPDPSVGNESRGQLVKKIIAESPSPEDLKQYLDPIADNYKQFNLVYGSPDRIFAYHSNDRSTQEIKDGLFVVSNGKLDANWPKASRVKALARPLLQNNSSISNINPINFFPILEDRLKPDDHLLPNTGIGVELEKELSPVFIDLPNYGTLSSTLMFLGIDTPHG